MTAPDVDPVQRKDAISMPNRKPSRTARLSRLAALGVAAAALLAPAVQAEAADSCLDQVREMASQHGTPSKPPTATPDGKGNRVTTEDLARSGGVIKPPAMDDRSVIKPPSTGADRMPTLPDVAPKAEKQAPDAPAAADRSKLQAALTAARAQAERGDEKGCQEALAQAKELVERKTQ
jgi:hypothetical protein